MGTKIIKLGKWILISIICIVYLMLLVMSGKYISIHDNVKEINEGDIIKQEIESASIKTDYAFYAFNGNNDDTIKEIFKNNLDCIESVLSIDEAGVEKSILGDTNLSYIYKFLDTVDDQRKKNKKVLFISKGENNNKFYMIKFQEIDGMKKYKMLAVGINFEKLKEKCISKEFNENYFIRMLSKDRFIVGDSWEPEEDIDYDKTITLDNNEYNIEFKKTLKAIDENKKKIIGMGMVSLAIFGVVVVLIVMLIDNEIKKISNKEKPRNNDEDIVETIQEKYKLVIEGANDIIWIYDVKKDHMEISDRLLDIIEYDSNKMKNKMVSTFLQTVCEEDLDGVLGAWGKAIEGLTTYIQYEFRMKVKSGKNHWFLLRGRTLKDDNGDVISLAGSLTDINEYKINESKISYLAYYDTLTGIPNIKSFIQRFEEDFGEVNNETGAMIFCDIDDLRRINNIMGHIMGDQVIKETAYRLVNFASSIGAICRINGDQFGIIVHGIETKEQLGAVCRDILNIFYEDLYICGNNITSTVSVGASLYGEHGTSFEELFKCADMALARSKERGKNNYTIFEKSIEEKLSNKITMEKDLRNGLRERKLEFYYQPKMNIKDKTLCGFEALIRWKNNAGWVSTQEFIKLAEEKGIMDVVGNYALEEVCKQIAKWKGDNVEFKSVAVNISPIHLKKNDFINTLKRVMDKYSIEKEELEIEITESCFVENLNELKDKIKIIVDMGVNVYLGNFGTGYSSIECFLNMPINAVKIDKALLLGENKMANEGVIEAITHLCHRVGLKVVAQGVETEEQLKRLEEFCCDLAQGYYIAKPMEACEVEKYITQCEVV